VPSAPRIGLRFEGSIEQCLVKPVFKLEASSDRLSLPEIAVSCAGAGRRAAAAAFEVKVDGPMDRWASS
jgi:hypothetical protein